MRHPVATESRAERGGGGRGSGPGVREEQMVKRREWEGGRSDAKSWSSPESSPWRRRKEERTQPHAFPVLGMSSIAKGPHRNYKSHRRLGFMSGVHSYRFALIGEGMLGGVVLGICDLRSRCALWWTLLRSLHIQPIGFSLLTFWPQFTGLPLHWPALPHLPLRSLHSLIPWPQHGGKAVGHHS